MIVWINGPFGVGKTTTAKRLAQLVPGAHVVNPEKVGTMIRAVVPKAFQQRDFQQDSLWPDTVVRVLAEVDRRSVAPTLVPMTVLEDGVFDRLMRGLRDEGVEVRHFALVLSPEVLARRIQFDFRVAPRARSWRRNQAGRCLEALRDGRYAVHIDADRSARQVAGALLGELG